VRYGGNNVGIQLRAESPGAVRKASSPGPGSGEAEEACGGLVDLAQRITPFSPSRPAHGRSGRACKREARPATVPQRRHAPRGAGQRRLRHSRREPIMKSTIGRPRKLADRQIRIILFWHSRYLAWSALGKTLRSQRILARELGVSRSRRSATSCAEEGSTSRCGDASRQGILRRGSTRRCL